MRAPESARQEEASGKRGLVGESYGGAHRESQLEREDGCEGRERPVSTEFRWREENGETRQIQEDGGKNRTRDTLRKRQKHRDGDE